MASKEVAEPTSSEKEHIERFELGRGMAFMDTL